MSFTTHDYLNCTNVGAVGAKMLRETSLWLPFLADLTHKEVLLFVRGQTAETALIADRALPSVGTYISLGDEADAIRLHNEHIIAPALLRGVATCGTKEAHLGIPVPLSVYPVFDSAGLPIAGVGMYGRLVANEQVLIEAAVKLLALSPSVITAHRLHVMPQDGVIVYDRSGRMVYRNEVAARLLHLLDRPASRPRLRLDESSDIIPVVRARQERVPVSQEWESGETVLEGTALPLLDSGQVTGVLLIVRDITLLRKKEIELLHKDVVIQEVHHRVKNNLQTVASLLRMQARRSTPEVREALRETERRVAAIAAIHTILAREVNDTVNAVTVADELLVQMRHEWNRGAEISWQCTAEEILLPSTQAVSLGMIVHELVQNACEHGAQNGAPVGNRVRACLQREGGEICFSVENRGNLATLQSDDGARHLGLQIVKNLAETNLGGRFTLQNVAGNVCACVVFTIREDV